MKIIFTISNDLKIAEMKEIDGLSRDFFPPMNIHKYMFQDFWQCLCRSKRESKLLPFSGEEGGEHGKCEIPRKHGPDQFRIWAEHLRGFEAGQQLRVPGMTRVYFSFPRAPSDICCA